MEPTPGRIAIFGDSSCLDSASRSERKNCFWLAKEMLMYTSQALLPDFAREHASLREDYISKRLKEPTRIDGNQLFKYSKVLREIQPQCSQLTFQHVPITSNVELKWPVRHLLSLTT